MAGAAAGAAGPGDSDPARRQDGAVIVALVVLALVVLVVGFGVVGFNKLRRADIGAQEALGGIDVQLTRRAELIPNLVETVKGYAAHERGVLEEVTRARAQVATAAAGDDVAAKAAADAQLSQALVRLNAVAEAYPDLKANQNFLDLQQQLATTEDQIAFARTYYNDGVRDFNVNLRTFPNNVFNESGFLGLKPWGLQQYVSYQATTAAQTTVPQVNIQVP